MTNTKVEKMKGQREEEEDKKIWLKGRTKREMSKKKKEEAKKISREGDRRRRWVKRRKGMKRK